MESKMLKWLLSVVSLVQLTDERGLLLLYRPKDISNDCVFSEHLRYDLSFGNGMSDTITLVFRTLNEIDYACGVEIVTDAENIFLLVVIRYPNNIGVNCKMNRDAFTVIKKSTCLRLCDVIGHRDVHSPYFIISVRGRIRFRFLSNSSINSDINANMYQVTATSARRKPLNGCSPRNESTCVVYEDEYCFTGGVVCDGIKNCGVSDWFDERKSECEAAENFERIGFAPMVAVVAVMLCLTLGAGHLLARFLPPLANSFFIFNANEDNRLCIDPVFKAPDHMPYDMDKAKRASIIPVSSSSSDDVPEELLSLGAFGSEQPELDSEAVTPEDINEHLRDSDPSELKIVPRRKTAMRAMTELVQRRLRSVAGRGWSAGAPQVL